VQLGLLILGLVILLSFKSDIADGAAGCFSSVAAEDADAVAGDRASAADVSTPDAVTRPTPEDPAAGGVTPVSVKVIRSAEPDAGATGGDPADASSSAVPADAGAGAASDEALDGGAEPGG